MDTIAIPWLHVIRPHPIFLRHYRSLFEGRRLFDWCGFSRRLRNLASRVRTLSKGAVLPSRGWSASSNLPEKVDVLIVSHLLNPSFGGQERDFYFGRVAEALTSRGIKVLTVLINYTKTSPTALAAAWPDTMSPRVVLNDHLGLPEELALHKRMRKEAQRIAALASHVASASARRLFHRAAEEAQSGAALHAVRVGKQLAKLVRQFSPGTMVTTYEGHSWERIAFASAREANPLIHCIGYQHSMLFNMQHAAMRPLGVPFDPDTIVTAGIATKNLFDANRDMQGVVVDVVGSDRAYDPLASMRKNRTRRHEVSARTACIVLPEGDLGECQILFGFSLECADKLPDTEFIWRLHPNTSYKTLVNHDVRFRRLPPNVSVSRVPIEEDMERSRWALYRGSTAIIQAAASGAFPIYLDRLGEISIDTLFELNGSRGRVLDSRGFCETLEELDDKTLSTRMHVIQEYCARLVTPLDLDRFVEILRAGKAAPKG